MYYRVTRIENSDELYHYGVKGMKWGVRRSNYYGPNKSSFKASNGLIVGAPKNRRIAAFRKVQGTKVGSAALNGMAKANTAFYGRGKNTWKRIEEQMRKENQAVRESNHAHKQSKKQFKKELDYAHKKFQANLKKLDDQGRGDDLDAVYRLAERYDKERLAIRKKYGRSN